MANKKKIEGIDLILGSPDEIAQMKWIGGEIYMSQLLAAWTIVDPNHDIPMNPQILGHPGVGKTTLAYSAAKNLNLPVYIFQCTVDTRPEDLLITPVIGEGNTIEYHASSLVTAMIEGGVCILDEANRMAEKSWASLAPLLDQRRYIESIIAGIKISAHPNFRICVTMNEDSSTFEVPEYIHSRLQPVIYIDFPDQEEEFRIVHFNLPYAPQDIIEYTVKFLQKAHKANRNYTIRDGINICRYYLKMEEYYFQHFSKSSDSVKIKRGSFNRKLFQQSIFQILGQEGFKFYIGKEIKKEKPSQQFQDIFDRLNSIFFNDKLENQEYPPAKLKDELDDDDLLQDLKDDDPFYTDLSSENEDPNENFYDDDDLLNIFEEEQPRKSYAKPKRDILETIFEKDLDENEDFEPEHDFEDPNDVIRKFLEKHKKTKETDPEKSLEPTEKKDRRDRGDPHDNI